MNALLELAVLCERASGPSNLLNDRIMAARYRREDRYIGAHYEDTNERVIDKVWVDPATDKWVCTGCFEFTGSIDNAMRLVPKGSLWSACDMEDGPFAQVIRPMPCGGYVNGLTTAKAATVPLAICAAALRGLALTVNARAATGDK